MGTDIVCSDLGSFVAGSVIGIACENLLWSVCDNEDRIWSVMKTDIDCSY